MIWVSWNLPGNRKRKRKVLSVKRESHLLVGSTMLMVLGIKYSGMYAHEVDVTRLRKRALLGNGSLQQYPDGVLYGVGPQAISRGTVMKT
jgi:hypothetical protein